MKTNTIKINENFEVAENLIITEFRKLENFIDENFEKLVIGAYRHPSAFVRTPDCYTGATRIYFDKYNLKVHSHVGIKKIGDFDYKYNDLEELTEANIIKLVEAIQELIKSAEQEVSCSFEIKIISK